MAKEIILSKESSESEIKAYFNAVLKLFKSDSEFPINLEEVWMLVYENRNKAVEFLKSNFIQDIDYQIIARKVQASNAAGFVWAKDYFLTVSCMEFFIARKVRPVFEVYRQVFHNTFQNVTKEKNRGIGFRDKMKAATWAAKFLNLNNSSKLLIAKNILEPFDIPLPDYTPSKGILSSATDLLKKKGISISAQNFNQKAMEKGVLEDKTRPSSSGKQKHFKSITAKGLAYGENQVNPNNPKSTQPLWYEDKFEELLTLLEIK